MLEYIIPFLIFVSLGVIVYIVGRHLPELKEASKKNGNKKEVDEDEEKAIKKIKNFFSKLGYFFKNGFFCSVEIIIKKIKQFLHLVHFWILKRKKGNNGDNELSQEIEVKRELIEAEEESLERIMEDDLIRDAEKDLEIEIKETFIESEETVVEEKKIDDESNKIDDKIESFFSEESSEIKILDDKKEKFSLVMVLGFFKNVLSKIRKRKEDVENEDDNSASEDETMQDELFSDGIVDVREVSAGITNVDENNFIKEVVPVVKKEAIDIDDEIGVDRSILEKKFVQKIANNPKDTENYRELGELYIKMKNFSDAEECYRQILRIHLRDVDAKRKLEKIKLLKRIG